MCNRTCHSGSLAVGEVDDPGDALDAVVPHQVFELFLEPVTRFQIRNLGDHDHVGIFFGLEVRGRRSVIVERPVR